VGTLTLQDPEKGANLRNTYSWSLDDPDPKVVENLLDEDRRR